METGTEYPNSDPAPIPDCFFFSPFLVPNPKFFPNNRIEHGGNRRKKALNGTIWRQNAQNGTARKNDPNKHSKSGFRVAF